MRKRNPINRLLSMVLCLCMVLSLLPGIPLVANAAETTTMKIYFRNDWNWTDIKLYFWGSKTATNPNWPGNAMSYYGASNNQNYYVLEVPTDVTGIIINGLRDNGSGRDQSPDIVSGWYDGITYYMFWNNRNEVKSFNIRDVFACKHPNTQTVAGYAATCTKEGLSDGKKCTECGEMATVQTVIPAKGHSFTDGICSVCGAEQYMDIYFRNDWFWSDVSLYFWGSKTDKNPTWPGDAMTVYDNDGDFDYYVMTVPTDVTGVIINGIKDDGSGLDQSPNIESGWHDGITYYMHWDGSNKVGNFNISDVKFPCKHPNQETLAGYAADCDTPGLTDGIKCSDCGETIKAQETIPALGHKWNDATCTEAKTCSVCGATEGEALGHVYNYDCDTNCVVCGELTRPEAIHVRGNASCKDGVCIYGCGTDMPATSDHDWDCYYEQAPSCGVDGAYYYHCLLCGDRYEEYPPATGDHTYDNACDAYCNGCGFTREPGEHRYTYDCDTNCAECGELTRPDAIHVSDSVSCTDGVCIYGCGTVVPAANEHIYDNDCDADCNECGDIRVPAEHRYAYDCDTNCVECGEMTRPDAIHVSDSVSCKDGFCIYGCGTVVPATSDHTYDNGCDADCNECGDFRVPEDHCYLFDCDTNCVVCGELTRPEAIHVSDAPSCKDGVCIYGCGTNMPATSDHDWDCYFEQAPSCGYDGAYYYQCLLCGESYEEYPPALGHEEPEYTNNGATHDIDYPCCDDEDDSYLPHSFVDGECACGAPEFINVGVYNEYGVADTITLSNTVATPGQDYVTVISSTVGTGISISGIYVALEDSWYGGGGVFEFDAQTNTLTVFGDYVGEGMQIDVRPYVTLTGHLNGGSVAGDYWEYVFEPDENGKFTYTKYCGAEDEFFSAYETCFVREGYKLVGYNTAADGTGTAYALDAVYTLTEDLEIYLIWECDHKWLDATCTAPKTCSVCGETEGEVLGHVDSDNSGRCDVCNILMQPAKICFATASLEGNIAINFYTLLSEEVAADPDAYMQFTMADDRVIEVYVRDAVSGELNGETYYVFTCAVNAKEMADDVICQFFYEGGSSAEVTYNVKAYGNYIVGNSDDASAKALAQAMLNYGAASQLHFGYNTDNLANSEVATPDYSSVTISGFNAVAGQGTNLAKLYSASLILKSETTLRFFFKVDSSVGSFTVSYNGQTLEVKERSGLYYVDVVGIAAKELNKDVEITINDGTTTANVSFNPMSYCQGVQNDTTGAFSAEMKDLVAALYLYNQAANEYFKEG